MRRFSLTVALLTLLSCSKDSTSPTEPVVPTATSVELSNRDVGLSALGASFQLTATVKDQNGAVMAGQTVTWASSDAAIVTVADGLVTAVSNGSATITATSGSATGTGSVTVSQVAAALMLSDTMVSFASIGDTVRVSAAVEDAGGAGMTVSVTWSSSDTLVVVVDSTGLITSVGNGTASIRAGVGEVGAEVATTVSQASARLLLSDSVLSFASLGDTVRLTAEVQDSAGVVIEGAEVVWTSSDTTVATVSEGLVTAIGNGTATLSATRDGVMRSAAAMVDQVPASIVLSESAYEFEQLDDSLVVTAQVFDARGNRIEGGAVVWQTSDGAVVSVADGLVIATGVGDATITATVGSQSVDLDIVIHAQAAAYIPQQSMALGASNYGCTISRGVPTCWGNNDLGQWGDGMPTEGVQFPTSVQWGHDFTRLASGYRGPCGLTSDGSVYCWGANTRGQLGPDVPLGDTVPVPTRVPTPEPLAHLSGFDEAFCGVTAEGTGYCWGANGSGQLGDGTKVDRAMPMEVSGGIQWAMIAAGYRNSCGIDVDRGLWCWGRGGSVGTGSTTDELVPVRVASELTFSSVSIAYNRTCAVSTDHDAYCWGGGGLGDGTTNSSPTPVQVVGGLQWRFLAATVGGCGFDLEGAGYCFSWLPERGTVGDGVEYDPSDVVMTPSAMAGGRSWEWMGYFGRYLYCGVEAGGDALCWGQVEFVRPCLALSRVPTSVLASESDCDVTLTPYQTSVQLFSIGDSLQLTAVPTDANGEALQFADVRWRSNNGALAAIDSTGWLVALGEGTTSVAAMTILGAEREIPVTIGVPDGSVSVASTPLDDPLAIGTSRTINATVVSVATGDTLDVRPTWTSLNSTIAQVDSAGVVTGISAGSATIVSSYAGTASRVSVEVKTVPSLVQYFVDAVRAAYSRFHGSFALQTAIVSDEVAGTGSYSTTQMYRTGFMGDGIEGGQGAWGLWERLHASVTMSGATLTKYAMLDAETVEFDASAGPEVAEAWLLKGFAAIRWAESFCAATFDAVSTTGRTEALDTAQMSFSQARSLASAAGVGSLELAALSGLAQVQVAQAWLGSGSWAAADAAAASAVEAGANLDWSYDAVFDYSTTRNELWRESWGRAEFGVYKTLAERIANGADGLYDTADDDPRTAYRKCGEWDDPANPVLGAVTPTGACGGSDGSSGAHQGADGNHPHYRQDIYVDRLSGIPLVSGREMRLIRAEASLRAGDYSGFVEHINAIRSHFSLTPLAPPTGAGALSFPVQDTDTESAWQILDRERYATLWLTGRRLYDLARWSHPFLEGGPAVGAEIVGGVSVEPRASCVPVLGVDRLGLASPR
jgi:uncharacterized protein YjdB